MASASDQPVLGVARGSRHEHTLPATDTLPALALDILIAPPPAAGAVGRATVLYVLDPEPILFGAACLAAYAGAGYYASARDDAPEAAFKSMFVIGIGHRAADCSANETTWDSVKLRDLRRRDFPPHNHPSRDSTRKPNLHSQRLAEAMSERLFTHIERDLLHLDSGEVGARTLLGASYSAALALQVFLHDEALRAQGTAPAAPLQHLILGSPSLPFDPELMERLRAMPLRPPGQWAAFIAYGALEREPPPPADAPQTPTPGVPFTGDRRNVHRHIPDAADVLADVLAGRGFAVDGAHSIAGEDHTSLKLSLVSRGVSWLCERWVVPAPSAKRRRQA